MFSLLWLEEVERGRRVPFAKSLHFDVEGVAAVRWERALTMDWPRPTDHEPSVSDLYRVEQYVDEAGRAAGQPRVSMVRSADDHVGAA
jgi:hypothetical protein